MTSRPGNTTFEPLPQKLRPVITIGLPGTGLGEAGRRRRNRGTD